MKQRPQQSLISSRYSVGSAVITPALDPNLATGEIANRMAFGDAAETTKLAAAESDEIASH